MQNNCTNLYFLSTLACKLSECIDEEQLPVLSADLLALSYMLESIQAHKEKCQKPPQ